MVNISIFLILVLTCLSGWMVVSYKEVALKKGWPIGEIFSLDKGGIITILGLIAQWGSVLICFFVNPWWVSLLVFILGYGLNIIFTTLLKKYTQLFSIIILTVSYILITIYFL